MNYEILLLWLLRTSPIPSPLWVLNIVHSKSFGWVFPQPWVVSLHMCNRINWIFNWDLIQLSREVLFLCSFLPSTTVPWNSIWFGLPRFVSTTPLESWALTECPSLGNGCRQYAEAVAGLTLFPIPQGKLAFITWCPVSSEPFYLAQHFNCFSKEHKVSIHYGQMWK